MKTFRFLYSLSKGHIQPVIWLILVGIGQVIVSLAFVWFIKACIDKATQETPDLQLLLQYTLLLILVAVLRVSGNLINLRFANYTSVEVGNSIRKKIFSHIMYATFQDMASVRSGDILTRMIKDTDDVISLLVSIIPMAMISLFQLAGVFIFLYSMDGTLAVLLAILIPILLLASKPFFTKMKRFQKKIKESESSITAMMEESFTHRIVLQAYERQEIQIKELEELQNTLRGHVIKKTRINIGARLLTGVAFTGGYITAFLWSVWGIAYGAITFGSMTAFLQLVHMMQRQMSDLMHIFPSLVSAQAAAERLATLFALEKEDVSDNRILDGNVSLHIENITYSYHNRDRKVLKDFSLSTQPGEMVAIMGETGAGKTTLLRVILSLILPQKGTLTIANEKESIPLSPSTRGNFVYVPQGNTLFSGSIRDNLLIGKENASEEELLQALKFAGAEFVLSLPEGLETKVSSHGGGLSEGQAQRISIARAFLRPGKILLLDEATSALDANTERLILQHLKQNIGDRTILFITHHSSVEDICDRTIRIG